MRVLHILGSIERSGAETMLRDAIERFRVLGVEVELLSTGNTLGRFASAFDSLGVRLHHISFRRSPGFFCRLRQLIRAGDFDVVHVHTERAALWVELTARIAGVKRVVRSVHSAFEFSGWLRIRRTLGRWLARRILGVRHVFVSPSVEANEVQRFGTIGVRVLNAVDTSRFVPTVDVEMRNRMRGELGIGPESIVAASVGSCTDVKQHDHALQAVSLLRERLPGLCYLHVGDGPNCEAEKRLAGVLGVADRCQFLGERDDVVRILQAADVFLMTSRYEGLGMAAIEASACGIPVIGYDVPGLRDAIISGATGELVAPEVGALAQAVEQLVGDRDVCAAYGRNGRLMAVERYSLDRWVAQHDTLYQGAVMQ